MSTWPQVGTSGVLAAAAVMLAVVVWPGRAGIGTVRPPFDGGRRQRLRRSDPAQECLVVLDALVAALRSGAPAPAAVTLAVAGVVRPEALTAPGWRRLEDAARRDDDVPSAWRELGASWRVRTFDDVASAWQMSERHGCPLADAMASAAANARAARRHGAAIDAATAGARATMGVLVMLPLLGIALGYLLGVDVLTSYRGPRGLLTLWPGVLLLWCGFVWTRRMVARAVETPAGVT